MEKQKLEIIITGVAVVFFLALLSSTLAKRTKKTTIEPAKNITTAEITKPQDIKPTQSKKIEWGRDPFVLNPERPAQKGGVFVLTAVMWDEKNPYAVINGEIAYIGKEINGYCVIKINKDNTVLKKGDQELTIELYQ